MDVLLRERRTRADGFVEYQDAEISASTVNLGSAPDQTIQLLGRTIAPRHAQIRLSGTEASVSCRRGLQILVNGESKRAATLKLGDVMELGGHRLQVLTPPGGFDLALELAQNTAAQASDFAAAFRTELEQTWLSKRRVAWGLFVLILAATLLVPLSQVVWKQGAVHRPWSPADAQWDPGQLLPAHQLAVGDDCNACHAVPFVRVRDEECIVCHDRTADHIEAKRSSQAGLEHTRCASCHQEHHEPPHLVVSSDSLCSDCHSQPERFSSIRTLAAATGFSLDTHPKFDARLLRSENRSGATGLLFDWRFETTPIEGARESSNLKFPHDVHLDASKVRKPSDSSALGCADCHVLTADKEHFLPVTMVGHCRSCHDLKFDPKDPTRELPHGQPTEAILAIEGHYLRKFGDPNIGAGVETTRRLPDRPNSEQRCTDTAFVCAMRMTRDEAVNQFTRRGCVTCHLVDDTRSDDMYSRFQVYPIRLVTDYLPMARFNHASHLTQKDATGDAACATCHDAAHSAKSDDLLIPDIDNCVECHTDRATQHSEQRGVVLPCIGCHVYHPDTGILAAQSKLKPAVVDSGTRTDL